MNKVGSVSKRFGKSKEKQPFDSTTSQSNGAAASDSSSLQSAAAHTTATSTTSTPTSTSYRSSLKRSDSTPAPVSHRPTNSSVRTGSAVTTNSGGGVSSMAARFNQPENRSATPAMTNSLSSNHLLTSGSSPNSSSSVPAPSVRRTTFGNPNPSTTNLPASTSAPTREPGAQLPVSSSAQSPALQRGSRATMSGSKQLPPIPGVQVQQAGSTISLLIL